MCLTVGELRMRCTGPIVFVLGFPSYPTRVIPYGSKIFDVRLKSKIYVQALIRRVEVQGAAAFVVRSGAAEAGSIFIKINRLDGTCDVLGPSQRLGTDGDIERIWTRPLGVGASEEKAQEYFDRQLKFDPDIWIVEIEDREGRSFVDEAIA